MNKSVEQFRERENLACVCACMRACWCFLGVEERRRETVCDIEERERVRVCEIDRMEGQRAIESDRVYMREKTKEGERR